VIYGSLLVRALREWGIYFKSFFFFFAVLGVGPRQVLYRQAPPPALRMGSFQTGLHAPSSSGLLQPAAPSVPGIPPVESGFTAVSDTECPGLFINKNNHSICSWALSIGQHCANFTWSFTEHLLKSSKSPWRVGVPVPILQVRKPSLQEVE
jgi:hypothetical protein